MQTQNGRNISLVNEYIASGLPWPAEPKTIAVWALNKQRWTPRVGGLIKQASKEIAEAMRKEHFTDAQGRRVRVKYAVRVEQEGKQITLWGDRNSPPEFIAISLAQRRRLVVGECHQLKNDVDSYNQNANTGRPIQMSFDFGPDLAEIEAVRDYERTKAGKSTRLEPQRNEKSMALV